LKFRRQTPIGPYIVDFVCLERELVVEIDGGQHMATAQRAKDEERTRWLETQGFMVLRFWNDEVLNQMEAVLERILRACELP
jgi:very-short-patch-repair endonuclease